MKIECPKCCFSRTVPANKVPKDKAVSVTCPKCQSKFTVDFRSRTTDQAPAAISTNTSSTKPIDSAQPENVHSDRVSDAAQKIIRSGVAKTAKWFAIANAAVIISIVAFTKGALSLEAYAFLMIVAFTVPFFSLYFSKYFASKAHKISPIKDGHCQNATEQWLFDLVADLSKKAGLPVSPEIGIYDSGEMNAFATGRSKEHSLVAFSTSLVEQMDKKGITGVAAHEIAHIASGDMLTMTIVQGVVNALVLLVSIPLTALKWFSLFSDQADWMTFILISIIKFIVVTIMMFLGNLVVKAFSRKREFEADLLASKLLDKETMVHSLVLLDQEPFKFPKAQAEYAAFKICSPKAAFDLFATHPSLERRIEALNNS